MSGPALPDGAIIMLLIAESLEHGHTSPDEGLQWAEDEGYIRIAQLEEDEAVFAILPAGREHVMGRVIVPEWN